MPTAHPTTWTPTEAAEFMATAQRATLSPAQHAVSNAIRLYLTGDSWQNADGYMGPGLGGKRTKHTQEASKTVETAFVSYNALSEACERHADGTVGTPPKWGWVLRRPMKAGEEPSDEEQALLASANALSTTWWNAQDMETQLYEGVLRLLGEGRQPWRLRIPPGFLRADDAGMEDVAALSREGARVTEASPPAAVSAAVGLALSVVYVERLEPGAAVVATLPETMARVGIVRLDANPTTPPATTRGRKASTPRVDAYEVCYVDDATEPLPVPDGTDTPEGIAARDGRDTMVRHRVGDDDGSTSAASLGGRLLVYEMRRSPFVRPDMVQLQRALNLVCTVLPRALIASGWFQRLLSNAKLPGHYEDGPDGQQVFVPDPFPMGPGITNVIEGVSAVNEKGATTPVPVGVHDRQPVPPDVATILALYALLMMRADQAHVLGTGDVMSGLSRVHARHNYRRSLTRTALSVVRFVPWVCETALALAEDFAGVPGYYTRTLRCDASCRLDPGPLTAEERAANREDVKALLLSREDAMLDMGRTDDPDAAFARMDADDVMAALRKSVLIEAVKLAVDAGASLTGACAYVGVDAADVRKLLKPNPEGSSPAENGSATADPGVLPNGVTNPLYPVGTRVRALVNHHPGMKGMEGVVSQAHPSNPPYYALVFDGETAEHKWVNEPEIEPATGAPPPKGKKSRTGTMAGMKM